jgi:hypothetical protein
MVERNLKRQPDEATALDNGTAAKKLLRAVVALGSLERS